MVKLATTFILVFLCTFYADAAYINGVTVLNFPATQPVSQSGAWTTGRTWSLSSGSDSVSAVQSGSPWGFNLTQILGAAPSATNYLPSRITNGTSFVDPTQIRLLTSGDVVTANQGGSWTVTANAGSGTFQTNVTNATLAATQSGTWNLNNISGVISLPTGASTSANQVTANTSLSSLDSKTPALVSGRQPVDGSGVTQPISAVSLPLPSNAATSTLQTSGNSTLSTISSTLTDKSQFTKITDGTNTATVNSNGSITVSGVSAVGLAPVNPPISVSGVDGGGLKRHLLTDTSGRLEINTAQSLPLPSGASTAANQTNGAQKVQLVDGAGLVYGPAISSSGNALPVSLSATDFILSTVNSTTTQLAAGATFTGLVETAFNQQSYSLLITSDQNGTLVIKQYIDAAGTRLVQTSAFAVTAGQGFARSGVVNGNFISITFTNNGASATTTLNVNMAYGTIPSATQANNAPSAIMELGNIDNHSTGSLAAADTTTAVTVPMNSMSSVAMQLSGTWAGLTILECTAKTTPSAADYVTQNIYNINESAVIASASANGIYRIEAAGLTFCRVRRSTATSGTVVVEINASIAKGPTKSFNASNFFVTAQQGNTASTTPWLVTRKYLSTRINTATTTTVKSGAGTLHKICINSSVNGSTAIIYDNTAGSGTILASLVYGTSLIGCNEYDIGFATGLTIVTNNTNDITVAYE